MAAGESALRQTLRDVLERWETADRLAKQAQGHGKQNPEAVTARQAAEAECWALSAELGDLLLLLVKCCTDTPHGTDNLRTRLMKLLAPDIAEIISRASGKGKHHGG